jgi:hypothetical protein
MSDVTVTNEPPMGNDPAARDPSGTLITPGPAPSPSTTPTPTGDPKTPTGTTDPKGDSFITGQEDPPAPKDPAADPPKDPAAKDPAAPAGAPEKYEPFKAPDGYALDDKLVETASATFKELNLTQDQAQKLVDIYAKEITSAREAPQKAWGDLQKEWRGEISNRFPGDKGPQVRGMINSAIDNALPPSLASNLRKALDITGAGSHPDVVEALSIVLKPFSEGSPVRGGGPAPTGQTSPGSSERPSPADALYGHLRK